MKKKNAMLLVTAVILFVVVAISVTSIIYFPFSSSLSQNKISSELKFIIQNSTFYNETNKSVSLILTVKSELSDNQIILLKNMGVQFTETDGRIYHTGLIYTANAPILSISELSSIDFIEKIEYGGHQNVPNIQ